MSPPGPKETHRALPGTFTLLAFDGDGREPGHAESPGSGWRHIDYSAAHKWPAVVDGDDHRASITVIGDAHSRPER
jgi:hypothetical protein